VLLISVKADVIFVPFVGSYELRFLQIPDLYGLVSASGNEVVFWEN
jgi:hypothetical protein